MQNHPARRSSVTHRDTSAPKDQPAATTGPATTATATGPASSVAPASTASTVAPASAASTTSATAPMAAATSSVSSIPWAWRPPERPTPRKLKRTAATPASGSDRKSASTSIERMSPPYRGCGWASTAPAHGDPASASGTPTSASSSTPSAVVRVAGSWRTGADGTVEDVPDGHNGDKLPVKMLYDRVLVQVPQGEGERRSRSGILIPATAQVGRRLAWAEVVAVGPNVRTIEPGDQVLFNPEDRFEVEVRGDDFIILRERDIHAVASERLEEGSTGLYL
jgi:chaperonin GroES